MRLTSLCRAYRMYKKPIGFEYRGKNRRLRPITQPQMLDLRKELEREEENMLLLRHPYLTIEEENGHTKHLREQRLLETKKKWLLYDTRHFNKKTYTVDRLKGLMVADAWE